MTDFEMPGEELLIDISELFKVFGDSTRIKILYTLHNGELSVNDIASALGMQQSAVSHQLKILKQAKLVKARKDGKNVFYNLEDDHVYTIIEQGLEHVLE